jgi:hypothetical protein
VPRVINQSETPADHAKPNAANVVPDLGVDARFYQVLIINHRPFSRTYLLKLKLCYAYTMLVARAGTGNAVLDHCRARLASA